tara:strand:+ start:2410 stop:3456 length:1047 start_codon:yes stop_codon:yes gene_type:complete
MIQKKDIIKLTIQSTKTIYEAIAMLEKNQYKFLIVKNKNKVIGTLTDGDIRRGTLSGNNLETPVEKACNKSFIYGNNNDSDIVNNKKLISLDASFLPILDENKQLIDILLKNTQYQLKNLDAVPLIIAGGYGKRLGSLTKKTPKPLIKVRGKALIEYLIENLSINGFNEVHISLHYMSTIIMDYLGDGTQYGIKIKYITEEKPLGTFGSVKLVESNFNNLLVINSDILTSFNLDKIVKNHIKKKNEITLGVIPYYLDVPFGVLDFDEEQFIEILEKPKYKKFINSGINVFSKKSLQRLDAEVEYIDLPDFINNLENKNKINKYEIKDYWIDVGTKNSLELAEKEWGQQ